MGTVRYSSKKDVWLLALVGAVLLLPVVQASYDLFRGNTSALGSLLFASAVPVILLFLGYPLYYELSPSALRVRCGVLIDKQIPFSEIQEVVPTRNPLSAPAWSRDRLHVNYQTRGSESFTLISPDDKAGFMLELSKRDVGLEFRGKRVVRVG